VATDQRRSATHQLANRDTLDDPTSLHEWLHELPEGLAQVSTAAADSSRPDHAAHGTDPVMISALAHTGAIRNARSMVGGFGCGDRGDDGVAGVDGAALGGVNGGGVTERQVLSQTVGRNHWEHFFYPRHSRPATSSTNLRTDGEGRTGSQSGWSRPSSRERRRTDSARRSGPARPQACADTEEVTGSNPVSPTSKIASRSGVTPLLFVPPCDSPDPDSLSHLARRSSNSAFIARAPRVSTGRSSLQ
jgi:hypothetical protein